MKLSLVSLSSMMILNTLSFSSSTSTSTLLRSMTCSKHHVRFFADLACLSARGLHSTRCLGAKASCSDLTARFASFGRLLFVVSMQHICSISYGRTLGWRYSPYVALERAPIAAFTLRACWCSSLSYASLCRSYCSDGLTCFSEQKAEMLSSRIRQMQDSQVCGPEAGQYSTLW